MENDRIKEIISAKNRLEKHPVDILNTINSFINNMDRGDIAKMAYDMIDIQFYLENVAAIYGVYDTVSNGTKKLIENVNSH